MIWLNEEQKMIDKKLKDKKMKDKMVLRVKEKYSTHSFTSYTRESTVVSIGLFWFSFMPFSYKGVFYIYKAFSKS